MFLLLHYLIEINKSNYKKKKILNFKHNKNFSKDKKS